ncbi:MAG: sensor histidine kinase, partial [Opitutaceae bacterium]
ASPQPSLADSAATDSRTTQLRVAGADRQISRETTASASAARPAPTTPSSSKPLLSRSEPRNEQVAQSQILRARETAADRRGWVPAMIDGRLHLFGWVQPGGTGDVRGVEVEVAALISRLGGALPAEPGSGEGYALRDDQGRILHQAGAVPRSGEPLIRVPFAAALLPGWDVTAHLTASPDASGSGAAFFWVSVVLVGIFVAAILSGGSLLLWQARRSEEEAAQKTSFVANVSHEFKTPLTTIRLYSELLEQGRVRDEAEGGQYLRTIGRETQRLARLVNNALDFSRLEQGRKKYARESIDLTAELGRLLDTHAPRVAEAGLVLKRELPEASVVVTTDRDALEQIVLNLIDNACKYAADGGEIAVALTARAGRGADVRVSDRGRGVPPEHRERIFEKFHRVDDALTAEKTGAGLGLSIARQLARGLGGELRYEPRTGAGAEFVLELP